LSGRLWLLTTLAVLLSEIVVFLPNIARERHLWLVGRVEDAALAASAANDSQIGTETQDALLRLSGIEGIQLIDPGGKAGVTVSPTPASTEAIDLQQEGLLTGLRRALIALVSTGDQSIRVTGDNPFRPRMRVELVYHQRALNAALRDSAVDFAGLSLLIAAVTGGIVYVAVLILLVRPVRRITGSIAAFRANPERTVPLIPDEVSPLADDEITLAGQELAAMQHELRAALWRNARLVALGTMVAKVAHDLRGILTPALLTAERLQLSADPKVSKAGDMLVQTVDRASELVRRALDYTREGPPPLELRPVGLAKLVDEAADTARPLGGAFRLTNRVAPALLGRADRNELFRVLVNLLRNAAEAGSGNVQVVAERVGNSLQIEIIDDGPGLPEEARVNLFRPFAGSIRYGGSGLGMAIARDLMLAHGGDIALVQTSSSGTTFRLTLPAAEAPPERTQHAAVQADNARIAPAAQADV
jgi:signal transduction histidine kinase